MSVRKLNLLRILEEQSKLTTTGISFIEQGDKEEFLSYHDLYDAARRATGYLQSLGISKGDELVFQIENNSDFLIVFWGCLLGGIIPVPLSVGRNADHRQKVLNIWEILDSPHLISPKNTVEKNFRQLPSENSDNGILSDINQKTIYIEDLLIHSKPGELVDVDGNDIAYVQFSSGSTGIPKGVTLTHKNLLSNIRAILNGIDSPASGDVFFSWMPLTHDMGLIGYHLTPLLAGWDHYIMPTDLFIRRPMLWLKKISGHRITFTASPNFGYRYVMDRLKESDLEGLDLSSLRVITNGAEPISPVVCEEFINRFKAFGLKPNTIFPVYGLAEACLAVTFTDPSKEVQQIQLDRTQLSIGDQIIPVEEKGLAFVNLGTHVQDCRVRVVNENGRELAARQIGLLEIKGENVTSGYYNNPIASNQSISEEGWLNTGDLGFIHEGDLFVTGRVKDIIFVNGQNFYAHDIERELEILEGVNLGKVAVAGCTNQKTGLEEIIVFLYHKGKVQNVVELTTEVRKLVNQRFGFEPNNTIPVREIPKTTSGKVQRYKLIKKYQNGVYDQVIKQLDDCLKDYFLEQNLSMPSTEVERKIFEIWKDLLGHENFGVTDRFFDIGGNSLKGMQLLQRLHETFDTEITFSNLFDKQTIRACSLEIGKLEKIEFEQIPLATPQENYPLSIAQKRLFYFSQVEKGEIAYNVPVSLEISGLLDLEKLEAAINRLLQANEILRTSFFLQGSEPLQKVEAARYFELKVLKISEDQIHTELKRRVRPFDLEASPLLRIEVLEVREDLHFLFIDAPHIVLDGVSMDFFIASLFNLYQDKSTDESEIQYKDFVLWEGRDIKRDKRKEHLNYWLTQFEDGIPTLELPLDHARPGQISYRGEKLEFKIDEALHQQLKDFSSDEGKSTFVILFTIYNILLSKYSSQEDMVVGVPITVRDHRELQPVLGMFVNNLPIRNFPKKDITFHDFLNEVHQKVIEALDHRNYSFDDLVSELGLTRELSRNVLFDTMFTYHSISQEVTNTADLQVNKFFFDPGFSKYDLSIEVFEDETNLTFAVEYSSSLFERNTIERMADQFNFLLENLVTNSFQKLGEISLLSKPEFQTLAQFNSTECNYPSHQLIHELIEDQAREHPHNLALSIGDLDLTYQDLFKRVDAHTYLLREAGIIKGTPVALILDRGVDLVVSIISILKAGGYFVPIDKELPFERIQYILKNAQCKHVLSDAEWINNPGIKLDDVWDYKCLININEIDIASIKPKPFENDARPNDLAYVIYTSGSTGNPKGVMVEHQSLVNYSHWGSKKYVQGEIVGFPLYTSISFDLTITSIFIPLISGNRIVIYPNSEDINLIEEVIIDNKVQVLKTTPSHLKLLKESAIWKESGFNSTLKRIIVGGEQLTTTVASDIHQLLAGKAEIYNEYGPTESTVGCMIHQYEPDSTSTNVPIGLPIDNVRVYILDSNLNPVPIGVPGELYLGGAGLSRGYMGDETQTATRFVSVESVGEVRLYRTGDVSRWLSSGKMEYLGRVDDQVKLNGYRIELGEIERMLAAHEEIGTAAVVMKYRGEEPYLAAYYESEKELETESLRQHLLDKLPSYMVPFHYVQLTQLPLTTNGKLDHKALPEPEVSQEAYEAPETQEEILLSEVWTAVLGGDNKGVTEDFFLVGGDSIRSIQISSRVRELGYELSIKDIFNHRTIREQAKVLKKLTRTSYQGEVTGSGAVTPIQHWFLTGHEGDKNHYHQSVLLNFKDGTTKEEVATIFKHLQQHHDALRTTFKETSGKWEATVEGYAQTLSIEEQDFRGSSDEQLSLLAAGEQLRKSIDITAGPLMKLGLYHLTDGSRVLIVVHHLVIDAVSWRIMFEDIHQLYNQYRSEETLQLPQKTDAFQLWTKYLEDYQQGFAYQKAKDYWQSLDTTDIHWELTDHTSGANRYADTAYAGFSLEPELTANLLGEAHSTYGTQVNDLLLASLLLALSKGYDHSNIQIDLEGHGREPLDQGEHMGRTVGWFTTIYPVVLRHEPGTNLGRLIKQVKESLHQVPHHGMDYLLQGQQEGDTASGSSILFNYLGQFDSDTSDRVYAISQEPSGSEVSHNAQRRHEWDVSGMVVGGELRLEISYSKERYESAKMTSFVALYKECLAEVITHCSKQSNQELTPSDVTHPNLSIDELDVLQSKYDVADVYPLSPMQEGILYHTLSEPDSDSYFEQITYQVKGELSMDVVGASMQELVARHGVLRTLFQWEGFDRPLQVVQNAGQMEIEYEDIREEVAQGSIRSVIEEKQKLDRSRKFDLSEAVLMRFTIYRTADDEYTFIWSHHHIVLDGWCMGILVDEFNKIYAEKSTGEKQELPLPAPYASYIAWLGDQDKAAGLNHWESYLTGYDGLASLPQKPAWSTTEQGYALNSVELTFDKAELQGLQQLSREYGVTTNTIFQMAWGLLLSRYNYTNDTVFGQVVSGRPAELTGVEGMVGVFINAVPVRINYEATDKVGPLLERLQSEALDNEQYQFGTLAEIQSQSAHGRQLLDHIMIFENYPMADVIESASQGDYQITDVEVFEQNNYDLTVVLFSSEELVIRIDYNRNRYEDQFIEKVLDQFAILLKEISSNGGEVTLSSLSMLQADEEKQLVKDFNSTEAPYPKDKTLVDLFEEQAIKHGDLTALRFDDTSSMSYAELDQHANRIAHFLQKEKGINTGDLVGVMLERGEELIPCIYGVLKAGAAYVPIDPHYPINRINDIIDSSNLKTVLTVSEFSESSSQLENRLVNLDAEKENIASQSTTTPTRRLTSNDLAYVIYTSGSTGKPKGVMIEHRAAINRLNWMQDSYPLTTSDVLLQKTPIVFDVSVWELFWWSLTGASLCLLRPEGEKDPQELIRTIQKNKVSVIHFVPSMFSVFLADLEAEDYGKLKSLSQVFTSGEALKSEQVNQFRDGLYLNNGTALTNLYGPTEATVDVTYFDCDLTEPTSLVPIGKPIDNITLFVLDANEKLVPVGVPGELYIAGDGVARGYLNNQKLTDERFVQMPTLGTGSFYRTGDLVRWLEDGNIEFLGRIDDQVKLRGLRIELGEIEQVLAGNDLVSSAVVLLKTKGEEPYLVAYYEAENSIDAEELRQYLLDQLPSYMIPYHYVHLEEFPLTPNGKLNRKALPEPDTISEELYEPPQTNEEILLSEVWTAVLGGEDKGVTEDYFVAGGDSIKSIQISSRVRKLGYELSIKDIFNHPTIREQAKVLKELNVVASTETHVEQTGFTHTGLSEEELETLKSKYDLEDVYPLTPMQEGILYHVLSEPDSDGYFEQISYDLKGELSLDLVRNSIEHLVARHSVLRSSFHWVGYERPLQVVLASRQVEIQYHDVRAQINDEQSVDKLIARKKAEDKSRKFDLTEDVLLRLSIYRISSQEYSFVWSHHHIILDGWCMGVLVQEFNQIYRAYVQGNSPDLPVAQTYASYISWLMSRDQNAFLSHWDTYLRGYEGLASLPQNTVADHNEKDQYDLHKLEFTLSKTELEGLQSLSRNYGVTINTIFQMTWGLLLSRYNRNRDVVFGQVVSGRPAELEGIEHMLGVFINTVPVRVTYEIDDKVGDILNRLQSAALDNEPYHYGSLAEIQTQNSQGHQLLDHIMIFENYPMAEVIESNSLGEYQISNVEVFEQTNYDFLVMVMPLEQLHVQITYNSNRYDHEVVRRISSQLHLLLQEVSANEGDSRLSDLSMLMEPERNLLLKDFNTTTKALPSVSSVLELFNEQVTQVPDSTALQYESGETLSYSALEDLSNQVSHFLQEVKGIKKGDLVGLMLERGPELVPFILGIMKLGAAYVPIDPEYPEERVKAIIAGSGINQLVGRPKYLSNNSIIPLINVDKVSSVLSTYSKEPVSVPVSSSDLAYVIYTSGSTGKPKGVMIEHGSLLNYVNWGSNHYLKGEEKSFALYSSISFDLTVTSIFIPLATGNKLVVYGEEQEGQGTLIGKVFMDNLSDVIKLTPSHLKVVKELITDPTKLDHKKLIVGGEQLTTTVASDIHQLLDGKVEIYNEYGPTESTVGCMIHQYEPDSTSTNVPIGLPIDNVRVYILDSNLNPVPIGVPGELYLGGAGLSRGYMGDDAQTATRFVSVERVGEERLYRTGDVSRWLSSGKMEYLGRVDDQVKLNGYRIELGEIERILATHEKIATAAVVMKYRGEEPYLAAYYESEQELETESLRQHLLDKLPSYMVPFHYVQLTQLPLTTNGKLDHKALPEPEVSQEAYEAPETQEEILLSEVWTAVLGGDNKGVTEDFFLVGGDSIRSIQISSRVRELGYELSIKDIFNHRTIREQAKVLKKLTRTSYQGEVTGSGAVTPIQHWFLTGHEGDKNHYHQSVLLNFKDGTTKEEVATIFKHLQQHHDALRTTFKETSGKWEATVEGYAQNLSIEEQDFRGVSDEQMSLLAAGEQLRKSIDITAGPLMKLGLYHLTDGSRLLLVVHHLVIDAVSWRIMFEDIHQLYSQYRSEETLQLPQKTDAFQLWTKYLEDYQQGFAYQKAKDYWQSLDTTDIHWELTDHTSGANRYADTAYAGFSLEPELTANLLGEAHSTYGTQVNDLLLASLLLALSKGYDHSNIQIDLEGHGREPLDQGEHMGRTVGWFTTIYPVVLRHEPGTNLGRLIKQVKESLHQVPHHGMDYLLQGQQEGDTASGSSILFNYLGQFDSDTSDRVYAISQEPSGSEVSHDAQRRHEWDVSGMVVGGELRLEISYSKERYESAKMTSFVALYKECLAEVITHCSKQSNKELTPSDVTHPNLSIDELDVLQSKYDVADVYPLSPMQEGILYHTLSEPDSDSYFEQITYQVKGELSMDVVGASMQELVARHGVLRTLFQWEGFDRPLQVVQNAGQMEIEYEDIREEVAQGSIRSVIEEKQKLDRSRKFDLSEAVLMRFTIYRTADDEYTFIWSHHHIVLDGWCMGILVDEFNKIYAEKSTGEKQELPLPAPYASYIAWLGEQDKAAGLNHWESYLAGYDGLASLPQKPAWSTTEQGYALNSVELTFDKAELQGLQQLSREYGVTTNTIFQMAWGLLLSRYNYTNDTVFGQVVSGRPAELSGVEGMVGVFINAVPVRINYEATDKVGPLLERLQSEALDNEQYQFGTLAEIQSQSAHGRQLLDHIMIFENYPLSEAMTESRTGGYAITHVEVFEQTNYDLVVIVVPREDLYVRLDYNSNRYEEHVIQQVMAQLKTLLKDISAKGGDTTLSSLNMVQESDKQLLLEDFNKTAITYPKDKTLIDLFKEQVANNSTKTAITYGEGYEMSYEELDQRSNRIARYLQSQGVGVGDLVGLLLFRGEHLMPCILGVLKSGGAYVPLDPNYPQGRIERIITDSGLKVLIHQGTVAEDLASEELTLLNVDSEGEKVMEQSTEPLNVPLQSSDLAYVIYTSGSTGNPKGVMVAHGNVHNFIVGMREVIPYDQESIMLCLTTISFDIFGLESLLPLMEGASMVLANEQEQNDVGMLLHRIRSSGITTMQLTPSRLELLLSDESAGAFLSGVSSMLVGGEAFPTDLLKKLKEIYQGGIYNMYGPTETTIWSTVKDLSKTDELTIGQPIANTQLYILGEQQELLPIGAEGELWIAGDGLARGYWGNEEMTNSRYIPCPYADGLMYRTGDMAKWLPNGEVAYLGRGDSQVKIRGFRIELGEIESQLRKQDNIKDAVTVIKSRGTDKYLVSYYVSDDELDTKTLRENLLSELPEYMVPYHYIHLEALPLTPNGKLDRRSLPDPDVVASTAYVAPANEVEEQLAEIWSGILNLEKDKISVEANFFELGGHSLKALNLINEVNKHYDIQLTLQYFFEKENIRNLADTIMTIKLVTPNIIDDESIELTL